MKFLMFLLISSFLSKVTCDAPRHCCQKGDQGCEGKCIPESWTNDGEEDCNDGSDEYGRWKVIVFFSSDTKLLISKNSSLECTKDGSLF